VIDDDFGKEPGQYQRGEMRDGEILNGSHASAPRADVGSGSARRVQRRAGPILSKSLLFYTDNRLDPEIASAVQWQLRKVDLPIVSVSLAPLAFGDNVVLPLTRGPATMFRQILTGLEHTTADIVFLVEHDCLYHPTHFEFTPPNREQFCYNTWVFKVCAETGRSLHYRANQVSGVCAYRDLLLEFYRERVAQVEREGFSRKLGFEPAIRGRYPVLWQSHWPNIDIRHGDNLTPTRWRQDQFRRKSSIVGWTEADGVPGWGLTRGRFREFLQEAVTREGAV
jgi:hypothetical protein